MPSSQQGFGFLGEAFKDENTGGLGYARLVATVPARGIYPNLHTRRLP